MDRAISASEANQRFSELLRDVAAGGSFVVTSHGKPVARVTPVDRDTQPKSLERLLDALRARPTLVAGAWTRDDLYD